MKVILQLIVLSVLAGQTTAFLPGSSATSTRKIVTSSSLFMSTETDPETKSTSDETTTESSDEPPAPTKWASEPVKRVDPRYEESDDDSPAMKAGKALKPLNDVVEAITSSPFLTPVLLLGPTLGNAKVRAEIGAFFDSILHQQ